MSIGITEMEMASLPHVKRHLRHGDDETEESEFVGITGGAAIIGQVRVDGSDESFGVGGLERGYFELSSE